jgi:4-amino-4-deoxy-L-arabinose transferase-like glycosyltransferase
MNWLKKNKEMAILAALGLAFFFIYSFLPLAQMTQSPISLSEVSLRFNTPDEVLNNHFADLYAESGKMYYEEPLNLLIGGVIFPRWARVAEEKITPGTFQGIILVYGNLAKIVGRVTIPFLTPFFAVIGVLFFYLLVKEFFEKRVAFVSALLMFIFPGFWYYASRTMFHNVLFLTCLLASLYFLVKLIKHTNQHEPKHKATQIIWAVPAGLFFGLALITRTSEVVWVALTVLIILLILKPKMKNFWPYALLGLVVCALCFLPILHNNKILYGSYFSFGYSSNITTDLEDVSTARPIGLWQALLLPFGFHPLNMARVFYKYVLQLFWPWLVFWLIGIILFFRSKPVKEQKIFLAVPVIIGFWLLIYYGSWRFTDNLSGLVSLGSSYVRYFLPAFVLGLPMAALVLIKLWRLRAWGRLGAVIIGCLLLVISYQQVFWRGPEALMGVKNNLLSYRLATADVLKRTQASDVILVDVSQDKIIFPERRHLIVPQNGNELKPIKALLKITNVWFFYRSAEGNFYFLNEQKFKPYGLEIYDGEKIDGGGMLFKVKEFERKLSVSS